MPNSNSTNLDIKSDSDHLVLDEPGLHALAITIILAGGYLFVMTMLRDFSSPESKGTVLYTYLKLNQAIASIMLLLTAGLIVLMKEDLITPTEAKRTLDRIFYGGGIIACIMALGLDYVREHSVTKRIIQTAQAAPSTMRGALRDPRPLSFFGPKVKTGNQRLLDQVIDEESQLAGNRRPTPTVPTGLRAPYIPPSP